MKLPGLTGRLEWASDSAGRDEYRIATRRRADDDGLARRQRTAAGAAGQPWQAFSGPTPVRTGSGDHACMAPRPHVAVATVTVPAVHR